MILFAKEEDGLGAVGLAGAEHACVPTSTVGAGRAVLRAAV